ncbi:MAG: imidazolonepropionase [Chromatiales bacterium]|jgi:imidazolonepropionase|nr:MAG: imidazolonepropionase [Chromatiales bacterium]
MAQWDSLWINGHVATMARGAAPYGAIRDGAVAVEGGRIAWVGRQSDLPDKPQRCAGSVHSLDGAWLTPGLIDCHTHLIFAGNRIAEFEARCNGASYEQIARRGGGILATVAATRAASTAELLASARLRLASLVSEGVTTLEIKSGYGLDLATERRILATARELGQQCGVDIRTTYLGAHAVPTEFAGRPDDYVAFICDKVLPALAADGLIDAVDAYCETIAFDAAQVERVFNRARELDLPVKLHADQLSDSGGAALAARSAALSADHLEYTGTAGVKALAASGTAAVLLPGAFYTLGESQLPPVAALRHHGVPMAIATDCNPGSSPSLSLLLMMNMGCHLFHLTPEECLAGVTRCAAQALGLEGDRGTLTTGKRADMVAWKISEPAELSYWLGHNPMVNVMAGGRRIGAA